MKYTLD